MKNFRIALFGLALLFVYGVVHAEGFLVGLEYESEKDNKSGISNHALTVIPGWEFPEANLINRVEVLFERNRDTAADSDGFRAKESKVFVRLRHDGELSEHFGYYVRGGMGRSYNNERDFNFAYVEPGLELKLNDKWEWVLAARETNAIDSTTGQHVHELRTGPNFDLDKKNEIEFRYAHGSGDKDTKSWLAEYVHRF